MFSLCSLKEYIANQIKVYTPEMSEIDYRISNMTFIKKNIPDDINKMKKIGKISISNTTVLDMNSIEGEVSLSYDMNKIESKSSFVSLRTNNALISGKWCYEVILFSNGLFQLGFCELDTPFTNMNGVGDDLKSYAFDGYRYCTWHKTSHHYGCIWDYGDVIGVCIDMDKGTIEYFINGKSLGIAFKNIHTGNIALFPGLSFGLGEKCFFNFGSIPFHYHYKGYEPIDIPNCHYTNSSKATAGILNILVGRILKILSNENISGHIKGTLSMISFEFLIKVSFRDLFLCKMLLFPFLMNLKKDNPEEFEAFIHYLIQTADLLQENHFISELIDKLCNLIEEYSSMIFTEKKHYIQYTTLLYDLLSQDEVFSNWVENGNILCNLRNLFTGNTFSMSALYTILQNQYSSELLLIPASFLLKKVIKQNSFSPDSENEQLLSETHMKFYEILFSFGEKNNEMQRCLQIMFRLINKSYNLDMLSNPNIINDCFSEKNKNNIKAVKNVIYPYMKYFINKFGDTTPEILSLAHMKEEGNNYGFPLPRYFGEQLIGGKSFHQICICIKHNIEEPSIIIEEDDNYVNYYFHLFLRFITPVTHILKMFSKIFSFFKKVFVENLGSGERGVFSLNLLFRTFYYLFNDECCVLLKKSSDFILKWMKYHLFLNAQSIYLMTQSVIDFPFEVFKILTIARSKLIEGNYVEELFDFYLELLTSTDNSNIIVSSLKKIVFVMKKPKYSSKIMCDESKIANLMKFFSSKIEQSEYEKLIIKIIGNMIMISSDRDIIAKHSTNKKILQKLFINFASFTNEKMTAYVYYLDYCTEKILNSIFPCLNKEIYIQYLLKNFNDLRLCVKVYEFGFQVSADTFFEDPKSLVFVQFKKFLINLSNRIIAEPYFSEFSELTKKSLAFKGSDAFFFFIAIVGIFTAINRSKYKEDFDEKISSIDEIHIIPFIDLEKKIKNILEFSSKSQKFENEKIAKEILEYNDILYRMKQKKEEYQKQVKMLPAQDKMDEEDLCILCYNNIADKMIIPCKHVACGECLTQYMLTKTICFICHGNIENIDDNNKT